MLIPNPSLLLSIKAFEKFVWWVVGGWVGGWWCLNVNIVIGFGPSRGLGLELRAKPINIAILPYGIFSYLLAEFLKSRVYTK